MVEPRSQSAAVYQQRLDFCEAAIEAGLQQATKGCLEVGAALAQIQSDELYRQRGYETFEAYCQKRWGLKRPHAYRFIDAAKVAKNASPIGDKPRESQLRELVPLSRVLG